MSPNVEVAPRPGPEVGPQFASLKEREPLPDQFAAIAHFYQPIRRFIRPDGQVTEVFPEVTEDIYQKAYKPILVDNPIPEGMIFSLYTPLRAWIKKEHPEDFEKLKNNVRSMKDPEYSMLADPFNHVIMPHLSTEDKDMMIKMGKKTFEDDFGFSPKGVWLPETAIDGETLWLLHENGYEFVVLREDQLQRRDSMVMFAQFLNGESIAVVPFEKELSGSLSFVDEKTIDSDGFLRDISHTGKRLIGTDGELWGSHKKNRDQFVQKAASAQKLADFGMSVFSVKREIEDTDREAHSTWIVERSSWSDEKDHQLSLWEGAACCGESTPWEVVARKREIFRTLNDQDAEINARLDELHDGSSSWRQEFADVATALSDQIFGGDNFLSSLAMFFPNEKYNLYAAKIYSIIGKTSCVQYFGGVQRPEREIATGAIQAINQLLEPIRNSSQASSEQEMVLAA